jgi:Integrase core domain
VQYVSIKYTERLAATGIKPSVGSVGDSYDNAPAETVIGLFKTEVIRRCGPWRGLQAVEFATLEWVDWFNKRRLLEPIGNIPPAETEARYFAEIEPAASQHRPQTKQPPKIPGQFRSCRQPHGPSHEPSSAGMLRHLDPFWCHRKIAEMVRHNSFGLFAWPDLLDQRFPHRPSRIPQNLTPTPICHILNMETVFKIRQSLA